MFFFCSLHQTKGTLPMDNEAFVKELLALTVLFIAGYALMVVA